MAAEAILIVVARRIADLLIHEVESFRGVGEDIQNLENELKWMQGFLKDANSKKEVDNRIFIWVAEVRDVACEIEDTIDTYVYKIHYSRIKALHLRRLRGNINSIKDKLQGINGRTERYKIEFHSGELQAASSLGNSRRTYPHEDEDDVIASKSTMIALKDQLMKEEDRRCVVSIVGMGGLGKTTLVKRVYNDTDVKKNFDCCAWVFISQQYVVREVLLEILIQVSFQYPGGRKYTREILEERKKNRDSLKNMEDHELVMLLKNELNEKRYLIVLDDIWSIDAWDSIKNAFPRGILGSKVVFTTRVKEVALCADPICSPIEPCLLTLSEGWELLQRKVFPTRNFEHNCPLELEEIAKEMLMECGGLPLAIVVLGGLLRAKPSLEEWKEVQKDVKSRINKLESEQHYRVEDILDLSFQELPYYLKPCFLYLGSFPEDFQIPKRRLIRLWIAEGFIHGSEDEDEDAKSMEEIAEQYLGELIDRCMVQVDERDYSGKGVKTCRLHDLMRDFCVSKANDEVFLAIMEQNGKNKITGSSSLVEPRRIAMHVNHGLVQPTRGQSVKVHPRLRSLLYFGQHECPNLCIDEKHVQLLRVLELDFLARTELPFSIDSLIHLRYLRVRSDGSITLPQSLSNLRNLQTLDLQDCFSVQLPSTMSRLVNLRHFLLPCLYSRPWGIRSFLKKETLTKIETLKRILVKDLISHDSLLPMRSIRALRVDEFESREEVTLLLDSLNSHSQLGLLRSLAIKLSYDGSFPKMELLSTFHALLKLKLRGSLSQENFASFPRSLTKLTLHKSGLDQEKMEVLEKLPNLRILKLKNDEAMRKWVCSFNGFPKLEFLKLVALFELEEWDVKEGAMPNLKRLDISRLLKLWIIPEGLKNVVVRK